MEAHARATTDFVKIKQAGWISKRERSSRNQVGDRCEVEMFTVSFGGDSYDHHFDVPEWDG